MMKMSKKLLSLLLCAVMVLGSVAIGGGGFVFGGISASAENKLSLYITDDGFITCNPVDGAKSYVFTIDNSKGNRVFTSANQIGVWFDAYSKLTEKKLPTGTYIIDVTAYLSDSRILQAESLAYNYYSPYTDLPQPKNCHWNNTTAVWDEVEGATSYNVRLYDYYNNLSISKNVENKYCGFTGNVYDGYYFTVTAKSDDRTDSIPGKSDYYYAYKLTFNSNGGVNAPNPITGYNIVYIPIGEPEKSGSTFLGWSRNRFDTVGTYKPGDVIKDFKEDTVLYAIWSSSDGPIIENIHLTVDNFWANNKVSDIKINIEESDKITCSLEEVYIKNSDKYSKVSLNDKFILYEFYKIRLKIESKPGFDIKGADVFVNNAEEVITDFDSETTTQVYRDVIIFVKQEAPYSIKNMTANGSAKYNQIVTASVKLDNLPAGATVKIDGNAVDVKDGMVSKNFGRLTADKNFTVSVVKDGKELDSKTFTISVKHGFFDKLSAFFAKIFKGDNYATTVTFK